MPRSPLSPPDPRAYEILAEAGLGADLFNPRQHASCVLVERYALQVTLAVAESLGVLALLDAPRSATDLCAALGFAPSFSRPLRWLLDRLRLAGFLARDGDAYRVIAPPPSPVPLERLRAEGLAHDASYAPAYELLDVVASLYPRVARGEVQAERALFFRVGLWVSYFSNTNGYYALSNRVAARAAVARLPSDGGTVLEVGAGLGSAAEAFVDELRTAGRLADVTAYRMTEPVPIFRRRAQRALETAWPDGRLTIGELDVNRPWAEQGIDDGSSALVWGVNVFHLAKRLDDVLSEARAALAADGWLIVGEGVRPSPDDPVDAELPFQLLDSFHDVVLDPSTRPTAGFLTADAWEAALRRAGFSHIEVVPEVHRLRRHYPGFLAAAFCARRS
jgi:SAM-dependent methyltransferase